LTGASVDADRGEEVDPPPLDEVHALARRAKNASGAVNLDRERRTAHLGWGESGLGCVRSAARRRIRTNSHEPAAITTAATTATTTQ
jgi:hypothetical protein